jgi:hypothetical protein
MGERKKGKESLRCSKKGIAPRGAAVRLENARPGSASLNETSTPPNVSISNCHLHLCDTSKYATDIFKRSALRFQRSAVNSRAMPRIALVSDAASVECLGATMTKSLKRRNIVMCLLLRFTPSHLQIWCLLSDVPGHPSKLHPRHLHDLYHTYVNLWSCSIRSAALLVLSELRQNGGRPNNTHLNCLT